jgi:iron(III) transport system substrate-binding protein
MVASSIFGFSPLANSAAPPWAPMGDIEAAAKKEGKLAIYNSAAHASVEAQKAISDQIMAKFGIAVEWTTLSAPDMAQRIGMEQRTRQHVADVALFGFGGATYIQAKLSGHLQSILAPSTLEKGVWRIDPAALAPKDRDWLYIKVPFTGILVNTNLVKADKEPKSYQDLLNPAWTGKIALQTPAIGGTGSGWFDATYRTLGLDYMKALAKQVALVRTAFDTVDTVVRSQYAMSIAPSDIRLRELLKQGAPLKVIYPREGAHLSTQGSGLIANAPHPDAAKLFLDWFYTKEGQTVFSVADRTVSVRKDVPQDHVDPKLRYEEGRRLLGLIPEDATPERSRELRIIARQIFEEGK